MSEKTEPGQVEWSPIVWSRLVKERDFHKCVTCGGQDELVAVMTLPEPAGGKRTLENGVTLCASCYASGGEIRFEEKKIRMNIEMGRSLYLSFKEMSRMDGKNISDKVRELVVEYLERRGR